MNTNLNIGSFTTEELTKVYDKVDTIYSNGGRVNKFYNKGCFIICDVTDINGTKEFPVLFVAKDDKYTQAMIALLYAAYGNL